MKGQMQQQPDIVCELTAYESLASVDVSDHRPVAATFRLRTGTQQALPTAACDMKPLTTLPEG